MVNAEGNNQHGGKLGKCSIPDDRSRTWLIVECGYNSSCSRRCGIDRRVRTVQPREGWGWSISQ